MNPNNLNKTFLVSIIPSNQRKNSVSHKSKKFKNHSITNSASKVLHISIFDLYYQKPIKTTCKILYDA